MAKAVEYKTVEEMVEASKEVIVEAFDRYQVEDLAIAWTGGKDSTLTLWLIREVCRERKIEMPGCFCIDEGDMFEEARSFIAEVAKKWNLNVTYIHNSDVSEAAGERLGAMVRVADLSERNRAEIARLGLAEESFPYEPESFVGNHLMKTVTCNIYLEERGIKAFFEGIRWDEQGARSNETYFSPREATEFNPEHTRICPILHFTEKSVWETIHKYAIPFCSLYKQGYRSLGAQVTTMKISDLPAWQQDLERTTERGGRRQDKEGMMETLRKLGYM